MKKSSDEVIKDSQKNLKEHRVHHERRVGHKLERFMYWMSLSLLTVFNLIVIFLLIPVLLFFEGQSLYVFLGFFGLLLGFLFNLLIMGIEHLERHHHIIAGIFIPVLALVDIYIVFAITERLKQAFTITYSSSIAVAIFITAFMAPYLLAVLMGRHK